METKKEYAVDLEDIKAAHSRIKPFIHPTPLLPSSFLSSLASSKNLSLSPPLPPFEIFLKCEHLQRGGAFKIRGALNSVLKLSDEQMGGRGGEGGGVLTHSSGNHGGALALATRMRGGGKCFVVMPENAPACKVEATRGYGAKVIFCGLGAGEREAMAKKVQEETGAVIIPPYDFADVIAGQGTVALEILNDLTDVDVIIAPISGGGLVSGITIAAKSVNPNVKIVAAEPAGADDAKRSKESGERQSCTPHTIADGLRVVKLGDLTWPVVKNLTDAVIAVTDDEIVDAMKMLFERTKQVVEPSGAISVAVALSDEFRRGVGMNAKKVVCVLSGGNVDLSVLPWQEGYKM